MVSLKTAKPEPELNGTERARIMEKVGVSGLGPCVRVDTPAESRYHLRILHRECGSPESAKVFLTTTFTHALQRVCDKIWFSHFLCDLIDTCPSTQRGTEAEHFFPPGSFLPFMNILKLSLSVFLFPAALSRGFLVYDLGASIAKSPTTHSHVLEAAPGVRVASPALIQDVLKDGTTTVVDARSIDELQESGFFRCRTCKWIHAPATPTGAPLLELAAGYLIPDKEAAVVVYCASGIRAEATRKILESSGYENVLNAGGLSDLQQVFDADMQ